MTLKKKNSHHLLAVSSKNASSPGNTAASSTTTRATIKTSTAKQSSEQARTTLQTWLQLARLQAEKCELKDAEMAYTMALRQAKRMNDLTAVMEALAGLLRLASEALNNTAIESLEQELDVLIAQFPAQVPPMVWYCKSVIARVKGEFKKVRQYAFKYVQLVKQTQKNSKHISNTEPTHKESVNKESANKESANKKSEEIESAEASVFDESLAKGWVMIAVNSWQMGRLKRAEFLAHALLTKYEAKNLKGINGIIYLLLGNIEERKNALETSLAWYQKAHASFLGEHNWYYQLYVLYAYARLSRMRKNYAQAYWYLDMIDKAAWGDEFGLLRREINSERERLAQDAVDLLIDSRNGFVSTRENNQISLRKQHILLNILEVLSKAQDSRKNGGLSKAEIIESVWKETYQPKIHDNKLYYNINRLRKIIEPDMNKPRYLLNSKEGYRFAPGLRVRFIAPNDTDVLLLGGTKTDSKGDLL